MNLKSWMSALDRLDRVVVVGEIAWREGDSCYHCATLRNPEAHRAPAQCALDRLHTGLRITESNGDVRPIVAPSEFRIACANDLGSRINRGDLEDAIHLAVVLAPLDEDGCLGVAVDVALGRGIGADPRKDEDHDRNGDHRE